MMRHQDAAALWLRLQEASDREHILRECVADIAMIATRNENPIPEPRLSSIVLSKFIFDYQRICLSTTSNYLDSINYRNIPLNLALDALSCLSSAAKKASQQARDDSHMYHVLVYLRQTFLAGLRSVLLSPLTSFEKSHVFDVIHPLIGFWTTRLEVDSRVTTRLISSAAVQLTENPAHTNTSFSLVRADRHPSQFLLDTKRVVLENLTKSIKIAEDPKELPYIMWLWSDSRLALINASYQYLFENSTQERGDSVISNEDVPEALEALRSLSRDFRSILQKLPEDLRNEIDLIEPIPHCHGCGCGCFETDDDHCSEDCHALSTQLANLGERLDNRKLATFNSSTELANLTSFMISRKDDFVTNDPEDDSYSIMHENSTEKLEQPSLKASYMLNCQKMHCVSGDTLRGWIKRYNLQVKKGLDELSRESELVKTYAYCPICLQIDGDRSKSIVTLARKITPLSQIFDKVYSLQNEALKLQASHSDSNTIAEEVDDVEDPPEPLQQRSEQPAAPQRWRPGFESSRTAEASSSVRSSRHTKRTSTSLSQATMNITEIPFLTSLTPDGRHVFIWYKSDVSIFNTEDEKWITRWTCESEIRKFSASNAYFAAMVNTATGSKVFVQSLFTGNSIISPLQLRRQVKSICLSPDGTKLLVSSGNHIDYVPLGSGPGSGELRSQPLPAIKDKDIESQCVSFSVGGERAILATRLIDSGTVCINIFDTTDSQKLRGVASLSFGERIPITNIRDFGLTQCPCYFDERDKITTWMVCSATDMGSQCMMQYKETDKLPRENIKVIDIVGRGKDRLGPSIIQAICLSASCDFLLIDEMNHVYVVRRRDRAAQWTSSRFTLKHNIKSSVTRNRHRVAVAANSLQQICIATVYNGLIRQIVYKAQSGKDENKPKTFPIVL